MTVKRKDLEFIEQLSKPKLPENIILYCVVQTDPEKFTIICKHALDCTNNDNLVSLVFLEKLINCLIHLIKVFQIPVLVIPMTTLIHYSNIIIWILGLNK